jgi:hypothetical protein
MTTHTWANNTLSSTDAEFRAWGSGISTALSIIGMVQTADTGQINWTTALRPTVANTYAGYEIWRFNDTLQATKPLFVKIEYGSGSSGTRAQLRFTLGKGSNGAGALTGVFAGSTLATSSSALGTDTVRNWYASSGDGSICAVSGAPDLNNFNTTFLIERSRDPDGAATGNALLMGIANTAGAWGNHVFNYNSGAISPVNLTEIPFYPLATGAVASGGAAPVFPMVVTDGLGTFWQPRSMLFAMNADVPLLSPITVGGFGSYLPLGLGVKMSGMVFNISGLIGWS